MANPKNVTICLMIFISVVSCARQGSIKNPIKVQPEKSHDVFADLLKQKAPRLEVEVISVLGDNYMNQNYRSFNGPKLREAVVRSLSTTGISKDSPGGDALYRVTNVSQAKSILGRTWPERDFSEDSKLGLQFKRYPRASIAMMEGDNQRIFFFDENNRLVAIYPESGGGDVCLP